MKAWTEVVRGLQPDARQQSRFQTTMHLSFSNSMNIYIYTHMYLPTSRAFCNYLIT